MRVVGEGDFVVVVGNLPTRRTGQQPLALHCGWGIYVSLPTVDSAEIPKDKLPKAASATINDDFAHTQF